MTEEAAPPLELRGISKSFGGVAALRDVDFVLRRGEIHGLVGENGAGKSTLMKIIAGLHADYDGRMTIDGRPVHFRSPREALAAGIGMVHQELSVVPDLTVAAASMVRVSQLCNHGAKWSCSWFAPCQWGWSAVAYAGWIFGRDNGICGSLTADCSDQRVADAYEMSKKYRDIIMRVTAEYASIPVGAASPWVYIGGQWVGGAVKAPGVKLVYSDATWRYQFESSELNCCDCFHPSPSGQNAGARVTFNGLNCSTSDQCCLDAWWDPVGSGRCQYISTGGRSFPGFFQQ